MSRVLDEADALLHAGGLLPPTLEELSARIPAYEFLEFIDQGGMGVVYKARQRSLDRIVAVKLLPLAMSNRREFTDRFKREARALALLNHPNIVCVYDYGEASGGCLYYVMEYVKGTNLRHLMRGGRASSRKLLSIAMQVCEALQFAHTNGVVHRDVKPANVLMDERGHVKVADFGLAKVIGPSTAQDITGHCDALGTPDYMAPEAVTHQHEVDHRADIYSLGVMLYEMLTGQVPRGAWQPPSRAVGADTRFDDVVARAMQADPRKRFQNVGELTQVMKQLVQASSTQGGIPTPALDRIPPVFDPAATTVALRPAPRAARVPRLAAVALGVALFGGVGFSWLKDHPSLRRILGVAPEPVAGPLMDQQDWQRELARFAIGHGGFVNVTTPFQTERLMGVESDIHAFTGLPRGEFAVWRVSVADRGFTDEDFAALVRLCEAAGSVTNVNLHGSSITPRGLAQITRMAETLTSLKLTETRAFASESLPFLATCRNLRLLFISSRLADASGPHLEDGTGLKHRLQEALPDCDIKIE